MVRWEGWARLLDREPMRCTFHVDGDTTAAWTEERADLPLDRDATITHDRRAYEIVDGPNYAADWDSAAISASIVVKPASTNH
jgi:hypothetical protein